MNGSIKRVHFRTYIVALLFYLNELTTVYCYIVMFKVSSIMVMLVQNNYVNS